MIFLHYLSIINLVAAFGVIAYATVLAVRDAQT